MHSLSIRYKSVVFVFAMVLGLLLFDATANLQYLRLFETPLPTLGRWIFFPSYLFLPRLDIIHPWFDKGLSVSIIIARGWKDTLVFFSSCLILCSIFGVSLRYLPRTLSLRFLCATTLLFTCICVFYATMLSSDAFLYISYARMFVAYHLNPLVTPSTRISEDPIYSYVYWKDQPSIYGPLWILITGTLQALLYLFHQRSVLAALIALRIYGAIIQLSSTCLLWDCITRIQLRNGSLNTTKRFLATLFFAWNPFLLLETVANAHIDATCFFLLLLSLWFYLRASTSSRSQFWYANAVLALAASVCIKVNIVLLLPLIALYVFTNIQCKRHFISATALFTISVGAFYLPFWHNSIFSFLISKTPPTTRNINTLADFLDKVGNALNVAYGHATQVDAPGTTYVVTSIETNTHTLSLTIFGIVLIVIAYMFWQRRRRTPLHHLLIGCLLIWLLYCVVGSPWFWPWYLIPAFGLFALLYALDIPTWYIREMHTAFLFVVSGISLYTFYTFAPLVTPLSTTSLYWSDLRGLWFWVLPCGSLYIRWYKQRNIRNKMIDVSLQDTQPYLARIELPTASVHSNITYSSTQEEKHEILF